MRVYPQRFTLLLLVTFAVLLQPVVGRSGTDLKSLKSGVWNGAVRGDNQGNATSCYLAAQKSNKEFWIILGLDENGLTITLYNKNWTLTEGQTFSSRVVIDKGLFGKVDGVVADPTTMAFVIGNDEPSFTSIQSGRRISFKTPIGNKSFRLQGTRKAVNVLLDCFDTYLDGNGSDAEPHSYQAGLDAYKKKDYAAAFGHWQSLAEAGEPKSQNALGILYYNGLGVSADLSLAAEWFRRAADQGIGTAQNNIGEMYRDGEGVAQDDAKAAEWFRLAAAQNADGAQENLDKMASSGRLTMAPPAEEVGAGDMSSGETLLAGVWDTSEGNVTIIRTDTGYSGSYAKDGGKLEFHREAGELVGIWSENDSNHKCKTRRLGSYHWGRVKPSEPVSGSGFVMAWGYCADGLLESSWDFNAKIEEGASPAALPLSTPPLGDTTAEQAAKMLANAVKILAGVKTGTSQDAFALASAASDLGDRRGQWISGRMLVGGVGVAKDRKLGFARILAAAENDDPDALTYMGLQFLQDEDASNDGIGNRYLNRAADQGSASAVSALRFIAEESQ